MDCRHRYFWMYLPASHWPESDTTCILKPSILDEGLRHDISTEFSFRILNFKSDGGSTADEMETELNPSKDCATISDQVEINGIFSQAFT